MSHQLLHLADPHIGREGTTAAFDELLAHIKKEYDPTRTAIFLAGDLVDRPLRANYVKLRARLVDIISAGFHVMAVPGNHDIHDHGVDAGFLKPATYAGWNSYVKPLLGGEELGHGLVRWRWGGRQILGLDTNAGTAFDFKPDLARGAVGAQQLGRLTTVLGEGDIVLGHHRVWWDDVAHALADRDDLHAILDPRASFYLCGHQHVAHTVKVGSVTYCAAPRCTERRAKGLAYGVLEGDGYERRWGGIG